MWTLDSKDIACFFSPGMYQVSPQIIMRGRADYVYIQYLIKQLDSEEEFLVLNEVIDIKLLNERE